MSAGSLCTCSLCCQSIRHAVLKPPAEVSR
ncbi:hypothetical protein [Pseudohaliea sp.]